MAKNLLINDTKNWIKECINGFVISNNTNVFALSDHPNVVVRKDYLSLQGDTSRVALISGGGSGHEPAHLGFIGHGMLTACVCGDLFASPSVTSILAAIRFVGSHNSAGVLLIIKNYTGDRLNFGIAAKRAQIEGIKVESILVDDDVSFYNDEKDDSLENDKSAGRRGLCGTIFVHKLAGALAEQRKTLAEIKQTVEAILDQCKKLRTIGVCLSERSQSNEQSESGNIEVGLGIHGERGRHRMKLPKCSELVKHLLSDFLFKKSLASSPICLMVNNLGGLSNLELCLIVHDCVKYINEHQLGTIKRLYTGTLMTSLNMNGFSISVLDLTASTEQQDHQLVLSLLDQHTNAPAWPKIYSCDLDSVGFNELSTHASSVSKKSPPTSTSSDELYFKFDEKSNADLFNICLKNIAEGVVAAKEYLNELDSECGDGDCGNSLAKVCENILDQVDKNLFIFSYPHKVLSECSLILENGGGTLCVLLALFCSSAASAFRKSGNVDTNVNWLRKWILALDNGIESVQNYGRVKPGQRSIIDPLDAVSRFLHQQVDQSNGTLNSAELDKLLKKLVDVTYESSSSTAKMKPMVGRASYVDATIINKPDAGATAISFIVSSIYKAFIIFRNQT